jgi:predicted metalloprotease with PDZ domain
MKGLLLVCLLLASARSLATAPIDLQVDMRNPTQRIYRVVERIPVRAGPLILHYPKWIPGEHSASGPIQSLTGLMLHTDRGERLSWRRDLIDPFNIRTVIPAGMKSLTVSMELISPSSGGEFGHIVWASRRIQALEWNQVLLYPGASAGALRVRPRVLLPAGWQCATALRGQEDGDSAQIFDTVTLDRLVDSPLVCGLNMARFDLAPGAGAPVTLNLIADEPEHLSLSESHMRNFRQMVSESRSLFGTVHYEHYDFLLTLSDNLGSFGLEHAQSSDDRAATDYLTEPDLLTVLGFLLPHEYVHSWSGKYRRPDGLVAPGYDVPLRGDLLWVYEGLTTYLGEVLTARSGIWTEEQYRDSLALAAADATARVGRKWRNLQDTADSGPIIYYSPNEWSSQRRGTDFYREGALVWLEVDTQLRELSQGRASLDTFAKAFFGSDPDRLVVRPYSLADILQALGAIQPYDWKHFFQSRLQSHESAPLNGITQSGWTLSYSEMPSAAFRARERMRHQLDLSYSLGLQIDLSEAPAAKVADVVWDSPAFAAGLAPGMVILAVDGRVFTPEWLREIERTSAARSQPIQLLVRDADRVETLSVAYRGGARYPRLERNTGEDWLSRILRSRTPLDPRTLP